MPFALVKSDPYKKGKRRLRRRFLLWSDQFWDKLCELAKFNMDAEIMREIRDMNERLYGKR